MSDEARVERVDVERVDPSLRESFDAFVRERGKVPNLFRIAAHRPEIGRTLAAHLRAVTGPGEVPVLLKELLTMRVSILNRCDYCLASHTMLATRAGASDAQVDALTRGDTAAFEPAWRAPIVAANEITSDAGWVSGPTYAQLAEHWSPSQIVEIVATIGLFNYFNRLANALEIPPTR
jgi:uncharacterized peroxidase-related enzyme